MDLSTANGCGLSDMISQIAGLHSKTGGFHPHRSLAVMDRGACIHRLSRNSAIAMRQSWLGTLPDAISMFAIHRLSNGSLWGFARRIAGV
jgi:hypothetical protein